MQREVRALVLTAEQRERVERIEQKVYDPSALEDVRFLFFLCEALVLRLAAVELEKRV